MRLPKLELLVFLNLQRWNWVLAISERNNFVQHTLYEVIRAAQIAGILEGDVIGNPDVEVFKLSKIEEGTEGSLTFLANPKYKPYIYSTQASVTIVNKTFEAENKITTTLIKVDDAYKSFSKLLEYYNQIKLNKSGIEQPSYISESANCGENVYIGAFSYIGNHASIGDNVV